jgi:hypothetical protein
LNGEACTAQEPLLPRRMRIYHLLQRNLFFLAVVLTHGPARSPDWGQKPKLAADEQLGPAWRDIVEEPLKLEQELQPSVLKRG